MDVVPFETFFLPAIVAALVLAWAAEVFVDGAAALSFNVGMPPILIGILVMGFGTSLPELLVSVFASLSGNLSLSLGNAYGSNIINIGLILGLAAVVRPVIVQKHVIWRELPLLLVATLVTALLVMDFELSQIDGVLLLVVFVILLIYLVRTSLNNPAAIEMSGLQVNRGPDVLPLRSSLIKIVTATVIIAICSSILVWSAKGVVTNLGVNELVVGVVMLALGTSLPELAVIMVAARRGEHELALGNIIGSNLFNTVAVVGVASLIAPHAVDSKLVTRDLPVMFALTGALAVVAYGWGRRSGVINKYEGLLLLLAFAVYMAYLIYSVPILKAG